MIVRILLCIRLRRVKWNRHPRQQAARFDILQLELLAFAIKLLQPVPSIGQANPLARQLAPRQSAAVILHFQTQFTNSNDAGLPNGLSGSATYSQEGTCWWAPALRRMIKCEIESNFGATAPASYRKRYAMNLTAIVVP